MELEYVYKKIRTILRDIENGGDNVIIRNNLERYFLTDKTKIIINKSTKKRIGYKLNKIQVSKEIVEMMAKLGDFEANDIINNNKITEYSQFHWSDPESYTYAYVNRNNTTLINIIENSTIKNDGNNTLVVYEIPKDKEGYKINLDGSDGEYIIGDYKEVARMRYNF